MVYPTESGNLVIMPRDTLVDFFADLSTIEGEFLVYDNGYRPQTFRYREMAGMARAFALQGDAPKARAAYQDFFAFWKDADPDVPLLRQAKAEYGKLR